MTLSIEQIQQTLRDKIPANLIVAEHTETGHFYRHAPTNQLFASVTTKCGILDAPHLKKWAAKLAVEHIFENRNIVMNGLSEEREMLAHQAILVHQDHFEDAGGVGTLGHGVIEKYLNQWMSDKIQPQDIRSFITEDKEVNDVRVSAIARSAELFCNDFYVQPIATEMFVASARHKFAGTLDSLMMVLNLKRGQVKPCSQLNFEGRVSRHVFWSRSSSNPTKVRCIHCGQESEYEFAIVDWKTSNSIDKVEYAMQTAAYWQALYEMTGLKPKRIYVVRLEKKYAKYEVRVLTNRVKAFKAFAHTAKVYEWLNDGEQKLVDASPREKIQLSDLKINNGPETSNPEV